MKRNNFEKHFLRQQKNKDQKVNRILNYPYIHTDTIFNKDVLEILERHHTLYLYISE